MRKASSTLIALMPFFALSAEAAVTTFCCDQAAEDAYLAAIAAQFPTATVAHESFEDGPWIAARTFVRASVTNLDITWNRSGAGLRTSTGGGDVHDGSYLMYASELTEPLHPVPDGFRLSTDTIQMHGVGGWFRGSNAKLGFIVDGDPGRVDLTGDDTTVSNAWKFIGFIDTVGFNAVDVMSIDETGNEVRIFFADDFNVAMLRFAEILALPDIGGSAAAELGVALSGSLNAYVRDAGTDQLIGTQTFNAARTPLDVGVADINGLAAIAALAEDASGRAWVEVRDAVTGTLVRDVWYTSGYTPVALAVMPDLNGNGVSELAVLLTKDADAGRAWVHIKDASTGAFINGVWFEAGYTPLDVEYVPNVDGNPGEEVAVLMTRDSDGRAWVHVKDAQTGAYVKNVWYQAGYTPKELAVIGNLDGNPGSELAVLMVRDSDSRPWVHLKDALTGAYVKNVWFDTGFTPLRLQIVDDLDANVGDELAVLMRRDLDSRTWVHVRDAGTGAFIRNVWYQDNFGAKDLAVLPNMDTNGGDELAVLGVKGDNQVQAEVKDAKTGTYINRVNFP